MDTLYRPWCAGACGSLVCVKYLHQHLVSLIYHRRSMADSFAATGIEYFNTFGGNSVACAIGEAVLDTISAENLQQKALLVSIQTLPWY
jgi:4-aminobutyrate aminotransferase-like enzyme